MNESLDVIIIWFKLDGFAPLSIQIDSNKCILDLKEEIKSILPNTFNNIEIHQFNIKSGEIVLNEDTMINEICILNEITVDNPLIIEIVITNAITTGSINNLCSSGVRVNDNDNSTGLSSPLSMYDPAMLPNGRVFSSDILIPNESDKFCGWSIIRWKNCLSDSIAINTDLFKVIKSGTGKTVQSLHLKNLVGLIPFLTTSINIYQDLDKSFQVYGFNYGIDSNVSAHHAIFIYKSDNKRGIYEITDNTSIPYVAIRERISDASNIAFNLLQQGYKFDDIMIPIIGSNGYLIQFTCLILLEPSIPKLVKLSKVLDLTDSSNHELIIAAKYFIKLENFFEMDIPKSTRSQQNYISDLELSLRYYHIKPLKEFYCCKLDLDSSISHHLEVMNYLLNNISESYKNFISFPICIRVDASNNGHIIFDKLHKDHWKIGLPIDPNLRDKYLSLLSNILNEIHSVGVVHLDLYPSNIMWRINPSDDTDILIKIIDWDSAHFKDEIFDTDVKRVLWIDGREILKDKIGSNNTINYDISLLNIILKYKDDKDLQSNDKYLLDIAFRNIVSEEVRAIIMANGNI